MAKQNPTDPRVEKVKSYMEGMTKTIPTHIRRIEIAGKKAYFSRIDEDGKPISNVDNPGEAIFDDMIGYASNQVYGFHNPGTEEGREELEGIVEQILGINKASMMEEFVSNDPRNYVPPSAGEIEGHYITPGVKRLQQRLLTKKQRKLTPDLPCEEVADYLVARARKARLTLNKDRLSKDAQYLAQSITALLSHEEHMKQMRDSLK